MIPIKFERVEIRKPRTDPNPHKSKTNNSAWRKGLFLVFRDYRGNTFDYMPKWCELELINDNKEVVESVNRELAKQNIGV